MQTTDKPALTPMLIRINDKELHKQAKIQAAKEGLKLYELVEKAIREYIGN